MTLVQYDEFDKYQTEQIERERQTEEQKQCYIKLNNMFLEIETGQKEMSGKSYHKMLELARSAYESGDPMIAWWISEIDELELNCSQDALWEHKHGKR